MIILNHLYYYKIFYIHIFQNITFFIQKMLQMCRSNTIMTKSTNFLQVLHAAYFFIIINDTLLQKKYIFNNIHDTKLKKSTFCKYFRHLGCSIYFYRTVILFRNFTLTSKDGSCSRRKKSACLLNLIFYHFLSISNI